MLGMGKLLERKLLRTTYCWDTKLTPPLNIDLDSLAGAVAYRHCFRLPKMEPALPLHSMMPLPRLVSISLQQAQIGLTCSGD